MSITTAVERKNKTAMAARISDAKCGTIVALLEARWLRGTFFLHHLVQIFMEFCECFNMIFIKIWQLQHFFSCDVLIYFNGIFIFNYVFLK